MLGHPVKDPSQSFHSVRAQPAELERQFDTSETSLPSSITTSRDASATSGSGGVLQSTMIEQGEYAQHIINAPSGNICEDDDVEGASISSTGTSIFDGQAKASERLAVTKSSRQDVSQEMERFVECYAAAKVGDTDEKDDADLLRPAVAKMASAFVTHVRTFYPTDSGDDLAVKQRVEGYLHRMRKRYDKRPPFKPTAAACRPFPDPDSIYARPGAGNKRLCSSSFSSQLPAEKSPRIGTSAPADKGASAGDEMNADARKGAGNGSAKPIATRTRSQAKVPPNDQPGREAIAAAWTTTIPTLNVPASSNSGAESTTLHQQEILHEDLRGQYEVAEDEMRRQEEERVRLKKKLEDWTKEQEEEKRQREATKRQQEAREAEEQRKAELSASTARLRAARDEQLKKLARNEEDLQHMREAAADVDRQRILAAALAAQPKPITTVNLEDEFELGADAAGFTPVRPRKKSTPSKQTPDSANRRPATPHRRAPLQSAMKKTVIFAEDVANVASPSNPTPRPRTPTGRVEGGRVGTTSQQPQSPRPPNYATDFDLAWIQTQQLAQTYATNARPSKPFAKGSSNDYKLLMKKFDMVANTKGMDARAKMLELSNWLDGPAKLIVDAETIGDNPEEAYERAREELDILFGRNDDATTTLLRTIESGKELPVNDRDAHVEFYARLLALRATAIAAQSEGEFDRQDILRKVLDKKVPHLKEKFWKKDEKARSRGERRPAFPDLMELIRFRANMLNAAGNQTSKDSTTKVAAACVEPIIGAQETQSPEVARTQTYAKRVAKSPPLKQPSTRCGVCDSFHATADCATLAKMDPDTKVKKLKEKNLCYHCLGPGHEARSCTAPRPRCLVCHKPHNTILHGRSFPVPAQRLSTRAAPFVPSSQNPSTTTTTNSLSAAASESSNPL